MDGDSNLGVDGLFGSQSKDNNVSPFRPPNEE